jgi:acyl-CoA dehydrogenase
LLKLNEESLNTSFALTSEQTESIARWRDAARTRLLPLARAGEPHCVNRPLVAALGEQGLLGRMLRDPDGGPRSISTLELCLLREALAIECTDAETALALQGLGGYPLIQFGGEALTAEWADPLIQGTAVAGFALSEPDAGSDVGNLQLRADRERRGFRLNGTKTWISNAPEADVYTLFARTSGERGTRGITAFAVPGDAEGFHGQALRMVSPHPIGRLELNDVFVPDGQVLGAVDHGFAVAMETLNLFRPSVGAFAVGMAQSALDATIAHAGQRVLFGRPMWEMQAVAHRTAEMATRVQAARLLVYSAAAAADASDRPSPEAAAMAKLFATETAQQVVDWAIQVHGAAALEEGHPLEHLYRDVRAPRIYEGASEVQREIIGRGLFRGALGR